MEVKFNEEVGKEKVTSSMLLELQTLISTINKDTKPFSLIAVP